MANWIFSTGHLGDPKDSKSIGNQFLGYTGIIVEINLSDRVQLATKLEHFVESLLIKSGHFAYMHAFSLQCNCVTVQITLIIS